MIWPYFETTRGASKINAKMENRQRMDVLGMAKSSCAPACCMYLLRPAAAVDTKPKHRRMQLAGHWASQANQAYTARARLKPMHNANRADLRPAPSNVAASTLSYSTRRPAAAHLAMQLWVRRSGQRRRWLALMGLSAEQRPSPTLQSQHAACNPPF